MTPQGPSSRRRWATSSSGCAEPSQFKAKATGSWADSPRGAAARAGLPSFALAPEAPTAQLARYRGLVQLAQEEGSLPGLPRCADRDDQKLLELAARVDAHALVSRDKQRNGDRLLVVPTDALRECASEWRQRRRQPAAARSTVRSAPARHFSTDPPGKSSLSLFCAKRRSRPTYRQTGAGVEVNCSGSFPSRECVSECALTPSGSGSQLTHGELPFIIVIP